jgi:UDP-2,3-diacylglucosamine pyrophosphatase LpxH
VRWRAIDDGGVRVERAWVISDLHLGGGDSSPLEDFRDDVLLAGWLAAATAPGDTLILNGDFIDFLQIEVDAEGPPFPPEVLWDEATSLRKLAVTMAAHEVVFDALSTFAVGGGTIRVTIGNHDLDLVWDGVQTALADRIGAPVDVEMEHVLWDRVHVEHGHRFTGENRPRNFRSFIHTVDRPGEAPVPALECPWGSRFVIDQLNPREAQHPYIDNVKPTLKLAYAMLRDPTWITEGRAHLLVDVLRFLRRMGIPRLGEDERLLAAPAELTTAGLENAFAPDEVAWRALVRQIRAEDPRGLDNAVAALAAEEFALDTASPLIELGEPMGIDEVAAHVRVFDDDVPDPHATLMTWPTLNREVRGSQSCMADPQITHVVLGHTHDVVVGRPEGGLFNPGSWIAHLDLRLPEVRAKRQTVRQIVSDPGSTLFRTDPYAVALAFDGRQVAGRLEAIRR